MFHTPEARLLLPPAYTFNKYGEEVRPPLSSILRTNRKNSRVGEREREQAYHKRPVRAIRIDSPRSRPQIMNISVSIATWFSQSRTFTPQIESFGCARLRYWPNPSSRVTTKNCGRYNMLRFSPLIPCATRAITTAETTSIRQCLFRRC